MAATYPTLFGELGTVRVRPGTTGSCLQASEDCPCRIQEDKVKPVVVSLVGAVAKDVDETKSDRVHQCGERTVTVLYPYFVWSTVVALRVKRHSCSDQFEFTVFAPS